MVLEEEKLGMAMIGKSQEEKLKIASLAETKGHLREAYKQCKQTIEKGKLTGLDCICSKVKDRKWIDQDNVRLGMKLYDR